tara:strand:- start:155 stop:322 length:168 start_codon:yes stop_codon:yes gene_type:complete
LDSIKATGDSPIADGLNGNLTEEGTVISDSLLEAEEANPLVALSESFTADEISVR